MSPPNADANDAAAAANDKANSPTNSNAPPSPSATATILADTLDGSNEPTPPTETAEAKLDPNSAMAVVGQEDKKKGGGKARENSKVSLTGTLFYSDENGERRHLMRGEWKLSPRPGETKFRQSFELARNLHPFEFSDALPMSGVYRASFTKADSAGSDDIVQEGNVDLSFFPEKEDANNSSTVKGEGRDRLGFFKLKGTATKKSDEPLSFAMKMEKRYIPQRSTATTNLDDTFVAAFERPLGIAELDDDGQEPDPPNSTAEAESNPDSAMSVVGQKHHGDDIVPLPAARAGTGIETIKDEEAPPSYAFAESLEGDSPDLAAMKTVASQNIGKQAMAWPEEIQDDTGPDLPLAMTEFTDSKKIDPFVSRPLRPINIAELGDEKGAFERGQPPRQQLVSQNSLVIQC